MALYLRQTDSGKVIIQHSTLRFNSLVATAVSEPETNERGSSLKGHNILE